MSRRPQFSMRATLRKILVEVADDGVTLEQLEALTGATRLQIQSGLGKLGEEGERFSAPITSKVWRHFATEAQRDAWLTGKPAPKAEPTPTPKPTTYTAGPSKTAQRCSGEVRGMDTAPRIVAKTPGGRFAPDPGYVGPFSLAGIGRDVQTGQEWA